VFPSRPDTSPDAAALLEAVAEVWPADGGRVSLNVASETALQDLCASSRRPT
jgi:EAL and modified HD-GYP domain-containing signal transduction protein